MFESGQDGNVAAIRTNVCVYPFLYLKRRGFHEVDNIMLFDEG